MAESKSLQYLGIDKPLLPYISYTSPINESPHFIQGSQNLLASQIGYVEKRPGFSTQVETILSSVYGEINRIFTWRRWAGSFFIMLSSSTPTVTTVWKLEVGVDSSFVSIWNSSGTSAPPYDFIVSDNFCFFGNATEGNMRKFDGTKVSKWGCDSPLTAPDFALTAGTLPPGLVFGPTITGTPTVAGTFSITLTITDSVGTTASQTLTLTIEPNQLQITSSTTLAIATQGTPYSSFIATRGSAPPITWTLTSGALPLGLGLNTSTGEISGTPTTPGNSSFIVSVSDTSGHTDSKGFSLFVNSSTVTITPGPGLLTHGNQFIPYSQTFVGSLGTGPYTFSLINGGLTQGLSLSSAGVLSGTPTVGGASFFTIRMADSASHVVEAAYSLVIDPAALTIFTTSLPDAMVGVPYSTGIGDGGGSPPYTLLYTAGAITAQSGYVWGYTYTTEYGNESNMSPLSDVSSLFTDQDVNVTVIASSDTQVNGINIYRSTDGGSQDPAIMRIVTSLPNVTTTYTDSTPDIFLGNQTGPAFLTNTPPSPMKGFIWSNGRIHGSINATQYYTGLEEISNGIAEECVPSGLDGNYYKWPAEVGGLAATPNGVDVGLSSQYWQISGDSLDTFRKALLVDKVGTRNPNNVISVGTTVFWIDTSKQIWSSTDGEIGEPIRTDLMNIDMAQTFITYHKSKLYNWLCVLDALNSKLLIYDLDLDQWNTPWSVPGMTCVFSGETTSGNIQLLGAFSTGHVMQITPGTYMDDGNLYSESMKTNLLPLMPFRSTTQRNHEDAADLQQFEIEINADGNRNPYLPDYFAAIYDDDPTVSIQNDYNELTANLAPMPFGAAGVPQGKTLQAWSYKADSMSEPCIRTAFWIQWNESENPWKLYSFDLAWINS